MRLLESSYEYPPIGGGGGRVVAGLAPALVARGHEVDLLTTRFRDASPREVIEGVQLRRVQAWRRREAWCTTPEMATYVLSAACALERWGGPGRWQLHHAHFVFPGGLLAWWLGRRHGLPFVITAHGSDVPGYNPDRFKLEHRLLAPFWARVVRSASRVICPSTTLERLVLGREPAARTVRVPNGFDPARLVPTRAREPRILTVSRLLERKGVQHLIRACEGLDRSWSLDVVGDGPFRSRLDELAAACNTRLLQHGWLDNDSAELTHLYETSSIFVLPSSAENFPVVLLEAMAAGLATITIEGTGSAEVVGDTGLLVPPADPAALRRAIDELIAHPELRARLGREGRERLVRRFAWREVAARHEQVYEDVLAERGTPAHRAPVQVERLRKAG